MSNVIHVENLSKRYRLGVWGGKTLREDVQRWWAKVRGRPDPLEKLGSRLSNAEGEYVWALRDINFSVQQGEVLGIIGRNGAGKSTLLKLLTRITAPTSGRIRMKGRVASMLEVGTGFHPELTGRENVFLNGAILGMTKPEVERKFDEIIDFSGVEGYIDTPVKRYSSGMKVRLAFAVAAHLEPEILLIDEVLAVGDLGFQKKCIGKMGEVTQEGRTVLFVSHNMASVSSLCSRILLLDDGKVLNDGPTEESIGEYQRLVTDAASERRLDLRRDRKGGSRMRFCRLVFRNGSDGAELGELQSGQEVRLEITIDNRTERILRDVTLSIGLHDMNGTMLFACRSDALGQTFALPEGKSRFSLDITRFPLTGGRYIYSMVAYQRNEVLDWVKEAGSVDVLDGDYYGYGRLPGVNHQAVLIDYEWNVRSTVSAEEV